MGGTWSALVDCLTADGGVLLKAADDGDHESVQQVNLISNVGRALALKHCIACLRWLEVLLRRSPMS